MSKELYNVTLFPRLNEICVYNPVKANIAKDNNNTKERLRIRERGKVGFLDSNLAFRKKITNNDKRIEIKLIEVIEK